MDAAIINAMFKDKRPEQRGKLIMLAEALEIEPRASLSQLGKRMELPVSSMHDCMKMLLERFELKAKLLPIADKVPKVEVPCSTCGKPVEVSYRTHETGIIVITGGFCHSCKRQIGIAELSPTLVRAKEAEMQGNA